MRPPPSHANPMTDLRRWLTVAWQRLASGRALPAALRARLEFERGERVLEVARGPDGDLALVVTDRGIYPRRHGEKGWSQLGWEQIARVSWDGADGSLVVSGLTDAVPARTVVPLRAPGTVPELASERIAHARLGRWQVPADGRRLLIEARRRPVTGELLWLVIANSNGDGHRLGADEVRDAIARLSADTGITPVPATLHLPRR